MLRIALVITGVVVACVGPAFLIEQARFPNTDDGIRLLVCYYLCGICGSIAVFGSLAFLYSARSQRGMWGSQAIDVTLSVLFGLLVVYSSKSYRWVALYCGFTVIAFLDYFRRYQELSGPRRKARGLKWMK